VKPSRQLVEEALAQVNTLTVAQAQALQGAPDVVFVDLREGAELKSEGRIPGALHVPRGLLEFASDVDSPWFNPALAPGQQLLLFCAAGWRSALAAKALQDMGRDKVCHLGGGFAAWKEQGGATLSGPG
jgi:rhodanese-related sulfurtransferase